jgi:GT2 family glycosyltransferase
VSRAPDIGVVVVSHRSAGTLGRCLDCLRAAEGVARIVIVDNASDDGSAAIVGAQARNDPRLQLLRNDDNRGFGPACNQGAALLDTPWVAFVNPDVYVAAADLARLAAHAGSVPGAGLLGTDAVDAMGKADPAVRRWDPSLRRLLLRAGARDELYFGRDPATPLQRVDATSGAVMLMPLALFRKLGGFDEAYRLHAEDLDLCRRVRAAGYEVLVANDITVLHLRGVSSRTRPVWVEWQKHRGLWRYFDKFDSAQTSRPMRGLIWFGLWAHFWLLAAPAAQWRRMSSKKLFSDKG